MQTGKRRPPWLAAALFTAVLWCAPPGASTAVAGSLEEVGQRQAQSAAWLQAVGRLQVPGSRRDGGRRQHVREDCSAALVARPGARGADTLLTAWHCLAYYDDLSKPITFTLRPGSPDALVIEAYRLADGGGMHADWALLRLYDNVPANEVRALAVATGTLQARAVVMMAGYARGEHPGRPDAGLVFDGNCRVTGAMAAVGATDCRMRKGTSGGPVVQLNAAGEATVYGVISEGDGVTRSTYVSTSAFRNAIRLHLR